MFYIFKRMNKIYVKHKKGYLNIDDSHFYFSDSGNWQNCKVLEETDLPSINLQYVLKTLFIASTGFLAWFVIEYGFTGIIPSTWFIGLIFLGIKLLEIIFDARVFKIPIQKVKRIRFSPNTMNIQFDNVKNEKTAFTISLDKKNSNDLKTYLEAHFQHKLFLA